MGGAWGRELIVVGKSPPWVVVVMPLGDDVIEAGRTRYRKMIDQVALARRTGEWPGIARGCKVPLRYPKWAQIENDAAELVVDGELVII